MAQITVAQKDEETTGAGATLSGVTSGNDLVAVFRAGRYFGLTPSITAVSGGDAGWALRQTATQSEVGVFSFTSTTNTSSTVTMSISTGTYDEVIGTLYELNNSNAYDTGAQNQAASGTALSSGATATLASDECLAIAAGMVESGFTSFTPGGGFTEDFDNAGGGYSSTTSSFEVTSTSGITGSFTSTTSAPWACIVTVMKPATSAATSAPPFYVPSRSGRALLRR